MFLKEVWLPLFDQKYNKNSKIVKYYKWKIIVLHLIYILKYNLFMWCKAEFSASLLQSHDSSEIILICWFAAK